LPSRAIKSYPVNAGVIVYAIYWNVNVVLVIVIVPAYGLLFIQDTLRDVPDIVILLRIILPLTEESPATLQPIVRPAIPDVDVP
jgi:uncharacterized protein YybS (DUF2232 family)